MTLYKALFLFQHNVQNQNHVAQKRSSCHNDSCFCQRTFFDNGRRSCGNRAVRRRFHTGVFLTDPPVAVFADEGGQTVRTILAVCAVLAICADHHAQIGGLAVGIGEDQVAIGVDLRQGDAYAVLTAEAVTAIPARRSGCTGVALVTGLTFFALRAGGSGVTLYALGPNAGVGIPQPPVAVCAYVGDKPILAVLSGVTLISVFAVSSVFTGGAVFAVDTVFTGGAVFAVNTIFAGGAVFTILRDVHV